MALNNLTDEQKEAYYFLRDEVCVEPEDHDYVSLLADALDDEIAKRNRLKKKESSAKQKKCETCSNAGEVHAIPVSAGTTFAVECCVEGGQHPFIRRGADCPFPEKYRSG